MINVSHCLLIYYTDFKIKLAKKIFDEKVIFEAFCTVASFVFCISKAYISASKAAGIFRRSRFINHSSLSLFKNSQAKGFVHGDEPFKTQATIEILALLLYRIWSSSEIGFDSFAKLFEPPSLHSVFKWLFRILHETDFLTC